MSRIKRDQTRTAMSEALFRQWVDNTANLDEDKLRDLALKSLDYAYVYERAFKDWHSGEARTPDQSDEVPVNDILEVYSIAFDRTLIPAGDHDITQLRGRICKAWKDFDWGLGRWRDHLEYVNKSPFLMGQTEHKFTPDIIWLLENADRVQSGRYHTERSNVAATHDSRAQRLEDAFAKAEQPEPESPSSEGHGTDPSLGFGL